MKKIFSLSTIFALALLFTSCQSEEVTYNEYGEVRSVSIQFSENGTTTRLLGDPQLETPAEFNSGDLYFTTIGGTIIRHFTISGSPTTANAGGNNINVTELRTTGVQIDEVPGHIRYVYIVGNTTGNPTAPAVIGNNISTVRTRTIHVFDQYDTDNVNLWGSAPLIDTGTLSNNGRQLFVARDGYVRDNNNNIINGMLLRPTVARIELREFEGIGQIASFTIDAIFIDRYFRYAQVGGAGVQLISREFTPEATRASYFAINPLVGDYLLDTNNAIHDIVNETGNAGNNRLVTSGAQVWGYNIFAGNNTQMPGIVIRLSTVTLTSGDVLTNQFLTIRGFRNPANHPTAPNATRPGIQAGNVYQVSRVQFDLEHLAPVPYATPFEAEVDITLAVWNNIRVVPPGFRQPAPLSRKMSWCVQTLADRTIQLGPAICGDCTHPSTNIQYRWQRSSNGINWQYQPNSVWSNDNLNFVFEPLENTVFFRRVAVCGCGNRNYSVPARVQIDEGTIPPLRAVHIGYRDDGSRVYWSNRNIDLTRQVVLNPAVNAAEAGFARYSGDNGILFQFGRSYGFTADCENRVTRPFDEQRFIHTPGFWQQNVSWFDYNALATMLPSGDWLDSQDPCRIATTMQVGGNYNWRLPTRAELEVLFFEGRDWVDAEEAYNMGYECPGATFQGGVIFGDAPNLIIIPAANNRNRYFGERNRHYQDNVFLWGSTRDPNRPTHGARLRFNVPQLPGVIHLHTVTNTHVSNAFSVRCVRIVD